jgi:hypothetical protein
VNAAEIAAALGKPQREGRGWKCLCPCHKDRDPSLSIIEKGGKLLVTCRAGCDQTAVVNELKQLGLWPNGHDRSGNFRIIASYDYHDEDGKLLFQVCRLHPKDFRQRRPDGRAGWEWSTKGTRMVPYRLPELLAAAAKRNGHPPRVYVVEGEKDADRLKAQWGLLATTNPRYFSGLDVVIIPDNDEPGRKHAHQVAANLAPVAASVRIVDLSHLPDKGDVSDWIAADGTQSDLETLVETTEPYAQAAPSDVWQDDDEPISPRGWLLGNTFCRQFLSALFADGGVGKTALRIAQYLSCATGRKLIDQHVFMRCRVLIICLEDGKDELRRRLRAARLHYGITAADVKGWLFLWTPKGIRLMEPDESGKLVLGELEQQLRYQIESLKIDLVGIDPFVKSHAVTENDNNAIDMIASVLVTLAQEYDCAADVVHHTRKGPGDPGNADLGRGAIALKDAARIVDTLTRMSPDEAKLFNLSEQERKLLIRLDSGKANLIPLAADARWFKLVGVKLGNPTDLYPHGDEVQTVECWAPPDMWKGLSAATLNKILDEIDQGLPGGRLYSHQGPAVERAAWPVVTKHIDRTEAQAREMIKTWLKNGVLKVVDYDDDKERKPRKGLRVEPTKRPG